MTYTASSWQRLVSIGTAAAVLVSTLVAVTPQAQAEERKAPAAQEFDPIPVRSAKSRSTTATAPKSRASTPVQWPEPATETVAGELEPGGEPQPAGDLPIAVGLPDGAEAPEQSPEVAVLGPERSAELVGEGVVFTIAAEPATELLAEVDYSGFAGVEAAGLAGRLRLVQLPACALENPEQEECRTQTVLETTQDSAAGTLTAEVALDDATAGATAQPSMIVLAAAAAATASDQGDFTATSLKTVDTWAAGGSSGEFSWSYPIAAPQVPGGLAPSLSIDYSSGRTDGAVSSTNNQSSWVGEGFDLSPGFIERKYISCADDQTSGYNNTAKTGDLCWFTEPGKTGNEPWDNATLQLAGHAGELVRVGNTSQWRLKDDDGTRIEKIGATGAEQWRVITTDGTQYYFGRGTAEGSTTATNSVWSVPVFGNHSGEPSRQSAFASSWASRPWRWNLDYVIAPTGDTMAYYWVKEQNQYKRNLATKTTYERGGYLSRIEYGRRSDSTAAAAKIDFTVQQRCDKTKKATCESETTSFTAAAWPDVPLDAICTTSPAYCPSVKTAPTFFTRMRLAQIKTSIRNTANTGYDDVDTWELTHAFPNPGDTTSVATLWPASIKRTGNTGTKITLPATTLEPVMLHNRVTGNSGVYGLRRPRLVKVTSEAGGITQVTYSTEDCTPASVPANPATNTTRCFPVYYTAGTAAPTLHWFSKYVVAKVEEIDASAALLSGVTITGLDLSDRVVTSYAYPANGGAWHYDESMMTPKKYRTWGVWRGYEKVTASVGADQVKTVTENTWFRGMNDDWLVVDKTKKAVSVTDSTGTSIVDAPELAGFLRETRQLVTAGGAADSRTIYDPKVVATTADAGRIKATIVDAEATKTWQRLLPAGQREILVKTLAWDPATGLPTTVEDHGDLSVDTDDSCVRTSYATPAGNSLILDHVAEVSVMAALCASPADQAQALSWSRTTYDNQSSPGTVGVTGLPTKVETLTGSASRAWASTKASYDQHGRVVSATDALGRTTTTAYTPAASRPVTATTVTSADPDGSGPLTAHVTTVSYEPRRTAPIKQIQPGGQTTEAELDALGRVTKVWQPGRSKSSQTASATYAYTVNQSGLNAVTTATLLPDGTNYRTVVNLFDSLLRPRQTQTQAISGRQVSDTRYTSRGLVGLADSYLATGAPAASLLAPTARGNIKTSTRTSYDYAERPLVEAFHSLEAEKWRTIHSYSGDRTRVDPPSGGTPTTTVADAHGRTTQLIQHLDSGDATTTYSYTPAGQLATMTDPVGNQWHYTWDLQGNRLSVDDPDAGLSQASYDLGGNVTSRTDARGVTLSYSYDQLNRPTATTKGATTLTSTSYDTVIKGQASQQIRHVDGAQLVTRTDSVDSAGRPTATTTVIPSIAGLTDNGLSGSYQSSASYNPDGSLKTATLPAAGPLPAETLSYTYNAIGLPSKLSGLAPYVSSTLYTQWDTVSSLGMGSVSGNLIYQGSTRDEATMRLTGWSLDRQAAPVTDDRTRLVYDPAGNITSATAELVGGASDTQCFRYDSQRQLTEAWTPSSADCTADPDVTALGGPAPYWSSWVTNAVGKTSSRTDRTPTSTSTTAYSYPADGADSDRPHAPTATQTTTGETSIARDYNYDAAGHMTERPGPAEEPQTLEWDDAGDLVSVRQGEERLARMVYDASGARVLRQTQTATTLYLGGTEITVTNDEGTPLQDPPAAPMVSALRYYSHAGATIAMRTGTSSAQLWTLAADHQGSTRYQVRNSDSQLQARWQDPYGGKRGSPPQEWIGERSFVGGTQDPTGLIRIGARDYDPILQRFVTVDPLQDLTDPLQWNPYLYANNTPITASDPSGELMCVDSCGSRADRQAKASRRSAIMNPSTGTGMTGGGVKAALPQQQTVKTETGPDYWGYLNSREFQGLAANALVSVGVGLVLGGFCAATAGIGCLLAVGAAAGYSGYLAQAVVTQHYDPREAVQATIGGAAGAGIGLALAPVLSGVKSVGGWILGKALNQTTKAATNTTRGISKLGGVIAEEGATAGGGRLYTATGAINQNDFAGIVNSGLMRGDRVHIITGAHGSPNGTFVPDALMYADDVARFGDLPGVSIHNLPAMSQTEVRQVLNGPGTIIGAFCDSSACLAGFR